MKNNDNRMTCTLKADLFKLKKHKSVYIGLAVMFAMILIVYCIYWIGMAILKNANPADQSALEMQQELLNILTPMGRQSLAGFSETCSISLFVAIIACIFIGKEFSNGTMRISVSRGANRVQLYFSKWLSLALLIVIYSVFAILVCGIFTAIKGYGIPFNGEQFGILLRCFALQLLCNLSTMSIVVMIAFLCRSSGASLGAAIGAYIALSMIFGIATTVSGLSGNTDWIMFMPMQQGTVASYLTNYTATELCAVLIMPIVYGGISTAIGLCTFIKRDIK